jgi:chemotaxis signal transduction protein
MGSVKDGEKYLIFTLGAEEYGMPIKKIREIIGYIPIIPFTQAAGLVKGVINIRGRSVPVMDLRGKTCGEAVQITPQTCILLVDLRIEDEEVLTGVVVDGVSSVLGSQNDFPEQSRRGCYPENMSLSWGSSVNRSCSVFVGRKACKHL